MFLVSEWIGILSLVKRIFVDTSVFFVAIMHLFSQSLSIVLQCGGQVLNVTFSFSSARCIRWPGFALIKVSCCVIDMLLGYIWYYVVQILMLTQNTVCSTSCHLLLQEFGIPWAAAAAHRLEFEVSWSLYKVSFLQHQFARCFLTAHVRMLNDLHYNVFDTGMLDGFNGAVNSWLLPWVVFSLIFRDACACGVVQAIYKQFCFSYLGLCCWF